MTTKYTLQVTKAINGWLVQCGNDAFVCEGEEGLAEKIAGVLVSQRLTSDEDRVKSAAAAGGAIQSGLVLSGAVKRKVILDLEKAFLHNKY